MLTGIPKISCSLLPALGGTATLAEIVVELDRLGVDLIHYDVSDHGKALQLEGIEELRPFTARPFDVHLSVREPLPLLQGFSLQPHDYFCLHVENELSLAQLSALRAQLGCNFGLALNRETPVERLYDLASELDFALFMAAEPGVSGGSFDEGVIDKIGRFKERFESVEIHVDGGVNRYTAAALQSVGVDTLVSGSYVLRADDRASQLVKLFGRNLLLPVSDAMLTGDELPRVQPSDTIRQVAQEIIRGGVGCACVIERGKLVGFVADGDLRRCIAALDNTSGLTAAQIMTKEPLVASPDTRLLDLIRMLQRRRSVTAVPVVSGSGRCVGLLSLNELLFR